MSLRPRDELGVPALVCDRCGTELTVSPNADAFDIGFGVTADGWVFGSIDLCRDCAAEPEQPRPRGRRTA